MATENFNLAHACCQRWSAERHRLALYCEDPDGSTRAYSFWDIQRAANRLSNALGALGTLRAERVAIILPQKLEAAVAHIACYQMGAVAVPLSPALDAERLAERLIQSAARVVLVAGEQLAILLDLRAHLPQLRHVVTLGDDLHKGIHNWHRLLEYASPRYPAQSLPADAPALLLHGDSGVELLGHGCLSDSLAAFIRDHEAYPQADDMFWSALEWTDRSGLLGALLPAWHMGQPVLAYRGKLDPQKTCALMAKHAVRNALLPRELLAAIQSAVPKPKELYGADLSLRTLLTRGEAIPAELCDWAKAELGAGVKQASCP